MIICVSVYCSNNIIQTSPQDTIFHHTENYILSDHVIFAQSALSLINSRFRRREVLYFLYDRIVLPFIPEDESPVTGIGRDPGSAIDRSSQQIDPINAECEQLDRCHRSSLPPSCLQRPVRVRRG